MSTAQEGNAEYWRAKFIAEQEKRVAANKALTRKSEELMRAEQTSRSLTAENKRLRLLVAKAESMGNVAP